MTSQPKDEAFNEFYSEVKAIEKRDSVLTPKQQIERLLRPGSSYFNLNPFEVLQIDFDATLEQIKTKYKRLSILVHPDKNQDDKDRAQAAFEVVNKAWKVLEDPELKCKCMDVVEEAKAKTDINIAEKKKKLRKEGKPTTVDEDDPAKYKHAISVLVMKLFADMERKRRSQETRDMEERKRKREEEIEKEEQVKIEKEWVKNFEASREGRVASWKSFQGAPLAPPPKNPTPHSSTPPQNPEVVRAKKAKKITTFRPPKHKAESR